MFRGLLRPGEGFKTFTVHTKKGGLTDSGRPKTAGLAPKSEIVGMISQADPSEIERYKQNGHQITHTIVQRGGKNKAKPTDVLKLDGEGRKFQVKTVHDPGELGHFTVYKVEEREDLQE